MDTVISVFTLNCWGIPFISKNRKERFQAIAKYLQAGQHNIVCLQEVWSESDYIRLRDSVKDVLPFSHYFYSGVLGSGLCVFSKWTIEDVFYHQWPLNGYIHKIQHADWFGGKGVGLCRIRCQDWMINVYCTHLHAEYDTDDIYLAHRILQAYTTAEFIKLTSCNADVVILAGDLNAEPGNLSYRLMTQIPPLKDPYDDIIRPSDPRARQAGGTNDPANNSYSNPAEVAKFPEGKRIDHILIKTNKAVQATVLSFFNPLEDRVPGHSFSYSDHNAVALKLNIKPLDNSGEHICIDPEVKCLPSILEAVRVCEEAKTAVSSSRRAYLLYTGFLFMFLLGTFGVWGNTVLHEIVKIVLTGLCFYFFVMGTLWNRIELNCLKGVLTALHNHLRVSRDKEVTNKLT